MPRPTTLSGFGGECKPSGDHICYRSCPVCGDDRWKVYVNPDTGLWKCFTGMCGAAGKLDVGQAADAYTQGQELMDLLDNWQEPVEWGEIDLPAWEPLTKMAKRYLRRRGIDEDLAARLGLVEMADLHGAGKFRILIPFFDRAGNMIYWNSRRYSDDIGYGPKYLTSPGKHPLYEADFRYRNFALSANRTGKHEVARQEFAWSLAQPPVVVEGVFDAIAVARAGYQAIALGGKSLARYLKKDLLTMTHDCGIIVVMLDSDALGAALTIRDQLSDKRQVRIIPCPPGRDPGDMSPDEIRSLI